MRAFLAMLLAAAAPAAAAPDLVILNAKVFTADPKTPAAEAVAVEKGRISFVGDTVRARALAGPATRVVDAQGRRVVPGLIEAHGHTGPYPPGKHRGRSNFTDDQMRSFLRASLKERRQLALHVSGDGEMARLFDVMRDIAPDRVWRARRVRIEHGDGLTVDLLPRARALGIVLVANPLHVAPSTDETGGEMMVTRLGEDRALAFQPLRSVLAAGVPLAFESDATGDAANPFLNMMLAIRYDRNPAEAVTAEQALLAYTAGAAFAEGQESTRGRIAVGYVADLAMLSQDILTVAPERLPATRSRLTLVDGRVAYEELPGR